MPIGNGYNKFQFSDIKLSVHPLPKYPASMSGCKYT